MKYIGNSFSLQMLGAEISRGILDFVEVEEWEFLEACTNAISCVGHADTAAVLGVQCRRITVTLHKGDELYVAQLQGGRLPEGCTTLPEGFSFRYFRLILM